MLTIFHPEVIPLVNDFPIGLLPLWLNEEKLPKLVIKAYKEIILAAKINQEFKIYAVPAFVQNQNTIGLVTAFFDNEDEPLVLRTPIFNDPCSEELIKILLCSTLEADCLTEVGQSLYLHSL